MEQEKRCELADSRERIRQVLTRVDDQKLSFARILRSAHFDLQMAKDVEAVLRVDALQRIPDDASAKRNLIQWVDDFVEHADMSLNPLQCAVRFRDAIEWCCREKEAGKRLPSEANAFTGKWSISTDEEYYSGNFDTLEDAIQEGIPYGKFFVGQCIAPTPPETLFDADIIAHWIEQVSEHDDYAGEWADWGAVEADRKALTELAEELQPLVAAWLGRHGLRPTHWNIDPNSVRYFDVDKGFSIIS